MVNSTPQMSTGGGSGDFRQRAVSTANRLLQAAVPWFYRMSAREGIEMKVKDKLVIS